jgi:hypothetical protein
MGKEKIPRIMVHCRHNHRVFIPCAYNKDGVCGEDGTTCDIIDWRYVID